MANYRLSGKAVRGITGSYIFNIRYFGLDQVKEYVVALESFFTELARRPELSKDASMFAYNLKYYNLNPM